MSLIAKVAEALSDEVVVDSYAAVPIGQQFVILTVSEGEIDDALRPRFGVDVTIYASYATVVGAEEALEAALRRIVPKLNARPDLLVSGWTASAPVEFNDDNPDLLWVASTISVGD